MLDMNDDATIRLDPDNILNSNESTCRSCTIDEYNANYLDNYDINTFSLLNQNIQSFNAKKSKLEAFLNAIKHDFHSMVLTETWNCENYLGMCVIENFDAIHTYRQNNNNRNSPIVGGGVSIFSNHKLYDIQKIDALSLCTDHLETCVARLNNKYYNIYYIIGIYRPPRGNKLEFIHSLENILSNDSLSNQKMIIAGDMNLNISDTNDNYVYRYLSMLTSFNFFSAITKPTHFF